MSTRATPQRPVGWSDSSQAYAKEPGTERDQLPHAKLWFACDLQPRTKWTWWQIDVDILDYYFLVVNNMALSCLNMSPYRNMWTHFRPDSMTLMNLKFKNYISGLQMFGKSILNPHQQGRSLDAKWHQGTGWYLASWSCLCSAVLRHGGGGASTQHCNRHDQLAKYDPVPWLRWHNVSWHQVFCYWGCWF